MATSLSLLLAAPFAQATSSITWSLQPTPNPAPGNGELANVSCPTFQSCEAVGSYVVAPGVTDTLAEARDGSGWTIQTTPNPSGASFSDLKGVACMAASTCAAVGSSYTSANVQSPLVEVWNGTSWVIEAAPLPTGAGGGGFNAVSCAEVDSCTAVGSYLNSSGFHVALAEGWNGTSWHVEATPVLPHNGTHGSSLKSVTCQSADACIAVGTYQQNEFNSGLTLAEAWNGAAWSVQPTPSPGLGDTLGSVACPSATSCTAVGEYAATNGKEVTLSEFWNGSSWSVQSTPNPTESYDSELIGLSCPSANNCIAVGYWLHFNTGRNLTLAESWNGTKWNIEATKDPGTVGSGMVGVSCPGALTCIGVGQYWDASSGPNLTLAEHRS